MKWQDSSTVQLASSFINNYMGKKAKRRSAKKCAIVEIPCPENDHQLKCIQLVHEGCGLQRHAAVAWSHKTNMQRMVYGIFFFVKILFRNDWLVYRKYLNNSSLKKNLSSLLQFN